MPPKKNTLAEDKTQFILRHGKIIRQSIAEDDLGFQDTILANLIEQPPVLQRKVARVELKDPPGTMLNQLIGGTMLNQLIGGTATGRYTVLFAELPHLPMKVALSLNKAGTTLAATNTDCFGCLSVPPGAVTVRDNWTPPSFLKILFCVHTHIYDDNQSNEIANVYLFFRTTKGDMLNPIYPNIFENGRICMGDLFERERNADTKRPLTEVFQHAFKSFHESTMNNHLVGAPHIRLYQRSVNDEGEQAWIHPTEAQMSHYGTPASLVWMPGLKGY